MSRLTFIGSDMTHQQPTREIRKMADEYEKESMRRIEHKLDVLTDAVTDLKSQNARIEEKQIQHKDDFRRLEDGVKEASAAAKSAKEKAEAADQKITVWINRGMGLWGGAMALWAILNSKLFHDLFTK